MGRRRGVKVVILRRGSASPAYLKRQLVGASRFWEFVAKRGKDHNEWNEFDANEIDNFLADWVQHEFESKKTLYDTTCGVLAVQKHFKLRSRLPDAWDAIRVWRRERPYKRRRPLNPYLWKCIVLGLLSRGGTPGADAWLWLGTAVLVLAGFVGLARPGELDDMLICHIGLPGDVRIGGGKMAVLLVQSPKNRAQMGETQFIAIENKAVIRWLRWWVAGRKPYEKAFPRYSDVSRCFKEVAAQLGLESLRFTLGSLRTGGATAHFRQFRNLATLQYLGRWSNPGTLAYYLQETMSEHLTTQIPSQAIDRLSQLSRLFHLLAQPPEIRAPRRRA